MARTAGPDKFEITDTSEIVNVLSNPGTGVTLRKTGWTTGETSGAASRTCVSHGGAATRVRYLCFNEFKGATATPTALGDSSAPVYSATNGGVNLHGILFGRVTRDNVIHVVYIPWQNIQRAPGALQLTSP